MPYRRVGSGSITRTTRDIRGRHGDRVELRTKGHTTAVELDRALQRDDVLVRCRLHVLLLSSVQVRHIRLVMLSVMKFHDLLADVRLEPIVLVREGWECCNHCCCWIRT